MPQGIVHDGCVFLSRLRRRWRARVVLVFAQACSGGCKGVAEILGDSSVATSGRGPPTQCFFVKNLATSMPLLLLLL